MGALFPAWQRNLLAQLSYGLSFLLLAVSLWQPRFLFKEEKGREVRVNVNQGVHGYFAFIRSQWKSQFSMSRVKEIEITAMTAMTATRL